MDNIANSPNIIKRLKNWLKTWWARNWENIAIFIIIVLIIIAIFGLWRLHKETPQKAPIKFESV